MGAVGKVEPTLLSEVWIQSARLDANQKLIVELGANGLAVQPSLFSKAITVFQLHVHVTKTIFLVWLLAV
jgi:hypothetical protein